MDDFCGFWRRDCDILSYKKNAEYLYTVSRDLGFVCVCANAMSCEKMQLPGNDQHNQATWFCQ